MLDLLLTTIINTLPSFWHQVWLQLVVPRLWQVLLLPYWLLNHLLLHRIHFHLSQELTRCLWKLLTWNLRIQIIHIRFYKNFATFAWHWFNNCDAVRARDRLTCFCVKYTIWADSCGLFASLAMRLFKGWLVVDRVCDLGNLLFISYRQVLWHRSRLDLLRFLRRLSRQGLVDFCERFNWFKDLRAIKCFPLDYFTTESILWSSRWTCRPQQTVLILQILPLLQQKSLRNQTDCILFSNIW